jgi:hypothetical protein
MLFIELNADLPTLTVGVRWRYRELAVLSSHSCYLNFAACAGTDDGY